MPSYDDSILLDADHVNKAWRGSPFLFDFQVLGRDFGTVFQFPRLGEIQRPWDGPCGAPIFQVPLRLQRSLGGAAAINSSGPVIR